jgi:hypothetical protein
MWNPSQHSNDDNVRWSWLRAVEWIEWPLFVSQPVVPVLLYFYRWPVVLGGVVVIAFLWRAVIVPFWVAPSLADVGVLFVKLKFITAPLMAYLLWQRGETLIAVVALLWPLIGSFAQWVMILPSALLSLTPLGKASQIGPVQARFLLAIGFQPTKPRTRDEMRTGAPLPQSPNKLEDQRSEEASEESLLPYHSPNDEVWQTFLEYEPSVGEAVKRLSWLSPKNVEEFRTLFLEQRDCSRIKEFEEETISRVQGPAFASDATLREAYIELNREDPRLGDELVRWCE